MASYSSSQALPVSLVVDSSFTEGSRSSARRQILLPVEILEAIMSQSSFISQKDLTILCLVNSSFCAIARPLLWRSVRLKSEAVVAPIDPERHLSSEEEDDTDNFYVFMEHSGPTRAVLDQNRLLERLIRTIRWDFTSFEDFNEVNLTWRGGSSEPLVAFFRNVAVNCSNLTTLDIDFDGFDISGTIAGLATIDSLRQVKSFSLTASWEFDPFDEDDSTDSGEDNARAFQHLLRRMAKLETLTLTLNWEWMRPWLDGEPTFSLREFSFSYHINSEAIENLCNTGFYLGIIRNSATSLTSLTLALDGHIPILLFPTFPLVSHLQLKFIIYTKPDDQSIVPLVKHSLDFRQSAFGLKTTIRSDLRCLKHFPQLFA